MKGEDTSIGSIPRRSLNRVIGYLIGFTFLLTVLFLWKEPLDFSLKINDEKIGNYFTTLGAVAAAVSIYFLYGHLIEIQEAKRTSSQPDLYPSLSIFLVKDNTEYLSYYDKPAVSIEMRDKSPGEDIRPHIELYNIGLGAAKNILIAWIYDKAQVVSLVKNVYYYDEKTEPEKEHLDFVHANGKGRLSVPTLFLTCCGQKLNQDIYDIIKPEIKKLKPSLKLSIRYQDIQNNWYDKTFNVNVEAFTFLVDFKFSSDESNQKG